MLNKALNTAIPDNKHKQTKANRNPQTAIVFCQNISFILSKTVMNVEVLGLKATLF